MTPTGLEPSTASRNVLAGLTIKSPRVLCPPLVSMSIVSIVSLLSIISMPVASMKAAVKRKICIEARNHAERQFQTASMLMRYETILARTLMCEFMLSLKKLSLDSMHLSVFSLDGLIQVDIHRYPPHDSNSTWSGGLFTGTVSADVV